MVEPEQPRSHRSWLPHRLRLFWVLAMLVLSFAAGVLSQRMGLLTVLSRAVTSQTVFHGPPGRWNETPVGVGESHLDSLKELQGLGYLRGSQPAPKRSGVILHQSDMTQPGFNLYTSGHGPEATLMDMSGNVLHRWRRSFGAVWPRAADPSREEDCEVDYWRRAQLLDGGDLLVIYEGFGLAKLDRASNVLWCYPRDDAGSISGEPRAHHDLFVQDDGTIYVLTRRAHIVPRVHPEQPIIEDFITTLTPQGVAVDHLSLLDAFEHSPFSTLLDRIKRHGDVFHTNTIEVFDGTQASRAGIFNKGNVLICLRNLDVIAVIDMEVRHVVWALTGLARKPHQPTLLDNGHFLLFDNLGNGGKSKVIEFDPLTQQTVWRYPADASHALCSPTCGSAQRLSQGHTLITETDRGRAIEIEASGTVVWEFLNPHRAGDHGELIASLFEVVRLPPETLLDWCERP